MAKQPPADETEFGFRDEHAAPTLEPPARQTAPRPWRINGVSPFLRIQQSLENVQRGVTFVAPRLDGIIAPWDDDRLAAANKAAEELQEAYSRVQAFFIAPRVRR